MHLSRKLTVALATSALLLVPAAAAVAEPSAGSHAGDTADGFQAQRTSVQFTYDVERRGDVHADFDTFRASVGDTLGSTMGWWRAGVDLQPVSSGGDFTVVLASPAEVDAAHEVCSPAYSCRVGDDVLINDDNWRNATAAWTGSITAYRGYLINHEVGHWLGLGHYDCPGSGAAAPVMQQQSIDLEGCAPNGWPLDWEVDNVAGVHGTQTRAADDTVPAGPANPGVVRGVTWYLSDELAGGAASVDFTYGRADDVPLMGDWNGDGSATPGVYREGRWFLRNERSSGVADESFVYGRPGDEPIVGDWNGDGTDTVGVRRGVTWLLRDSNSAGHADEVFDFGRSTDVPVVGDWNGDGVDHAGVYRGGDWYLRLSHTGGNADASMWFGQPHGVPVVGDWHGEGQDRLGYRRGAIWHLQHGGTVIADAATFQFGRADDTPVTWR